MKTTSGLYSIFIKTAKTQMQLRRLMIALLFKGKLVNYNMEDQKDRGL